MVKLIKIERSNKPNKKFKALFEVNKKRKEVHFGDSRYEDEKRKLNYLKRHKANKCFVALCIVGKTRYNGGSQQFLHHPGK